MNDSGSRWFGRLLIAALVALDQGLKHWVEARFFFGAELVPGWLAVAPSVNSNQIWLGYWIPMLRDPVTATAINLAAMGLMLLVWRRGDVYRKIAPRAASIIWVLAFSGGLCSLFDKLFWNGSLDYLIVRGCIALDLKDLYVAAAELLFIVTAVRVFYGNPNNHEQPCRIEP